jgi:5-formyltetrahydrofolate cyclo-ligase
MGMGYYDRFLASVPQALRIALAFEYQLLSGGLEQNSWDQPLHWILTATREFRSPRAQAWIAAKK